MFKKNSLLELSTLSHSPHHLIPKLIRDKSLILDVGCNTGMIGKTIIEKKEAVVDGIDINQKALDKAKENNYRKVFLRDLYQPELNIEPREYDYILFSDILEHLPRPDLVLIDSQKYLKDSGRIIISLPNIARLEIRLKLLLGNFDYAPGILSEDHLRFFTKKSATKMINDTGYQVEKILPTGLGHLIKVWPNLTAFQFIFICQKKKEDETNC